MKLSFRRIMSAAIVTVMSATLLSACSTSEPAKPAAGTTEATSSSTKPFAGQKLSIITANHPWGDAVKTLVPQFEEKRVSR